MLITLRIPVEIVYEVEVDYTPAQVGRAYMANGDPGWPDEPAEAEIISTRALSDPLAEITEMDLISECEEWLRENDEGGF
jgi:hypothetical protein